MKISIYLSHPNNVNGNLPIDKLLGFLYEGSFECRGQRSITHTQSMLQSQTYALRSLNAGRKTIRWDAMGPDWDEDTNPADGTADARMDDFYYRTFYQQWFSHTRFGADKYKLIFQDALPRIFPLLQGFLDTLDRRDADIPLSYSIAVHAMTTAIICVQGNGDVKRIASVSKRATQTFNHQISGLIDCKVVDMTDNIDCVLKKVKMFEEVTKPTLNHIHSAPADLLGSWNPLVAGSLLMQTSYMNSMRFGIPAMNTNNQAVSTMHILNALSVRKLIDVNKIPLMDILDTALEGSKPIWGDGKPPLGSFTKYFFISIGTSLSASATISKFVTSMPWHQFKRFQTEMSEDKRAEMEGLLARQIELEDNLDVVRLKILMGMRETFKRGSRMEKRYLTPSDISLSYRFCVERNFSGNVENVSSGNCIDAMSTAGTYATLMNYYERYKALDNQIPMDAMKMAINFPKLSWVLADFMSKLDEAMGWNDIIVEVIKGPLSDWKASNKVKRQYVLLNLIGDRILGELDSDLHSDLCTESKKCASFMKGYFEAFEKMDIALF